MRRRIILAALSCAAVILILTGCSGVLIPENKVITLSQTESSPVNITSFMVRQGGRVQDISEGGSQVRQSDSLRRARTAPPSICLTQLPAASSILSRLTLSSGALNSPTRASTIRREPPTARLTADIIRSCGILSIKVPRRRSRLLRR